MPRVQKIHAVFALPIGNQPLPCGMDPAVQRLIDQVASAATDTRPLRIRGAGSKDFYGQTLQGEVLDTSAVRGIVSYEPSELVVTVRAGTPLAELEATLAEQNQCLPFEPPRFGNSEQNGGTVGGMVATGLSGPARASAGAVRDFMLGVTLINGRAELLTFGGTVMKNVAGYDVSRLMCGALGTLGVLTEVNLKVLPVAPAEATLRFAMPQLDALRQLNTWGGQPLPLNASCWVDNVLWVRLRGAVAAVEAACASMGGERLNADAFANGFDWSACRDQRLPWFAPQEGRDGLDLWRLAVPQTAPVLDLPYAQLVEWHGGQRWLWAPPAAAAQVRNTAQAVGGNATLFIAAAAARDTGDRSLMDALKPPLDRLHANLKREFDPAGIFNRGRLYADL
jgi:glycolate oxidase FAD binding subunit